MKDLKKLIVIGGTHPLPDMNCWIPSFIPMASVMLVTHLAWNRDRKNRHIYIHVHINTHTYMYMYTLTYMYMCSLNCVCVCVCVLKLAIHLIQHIQNLPFLLIVRTYCFTITI